MKKIFFLPLLLLSLTVFSQIHTKGQKGIRPTLHIDSVAIKLQRMKDSAQKTIEQIHTENNIRNMMDVMNTVEKRKKKEKTKAILYIAIGVGMLIVLIVGLRRRTVGKS